MARYLFAGRPGDFTIVDPATTSNIVNAAPSLTGGTVWSAATGGTQYTDLLTAAGGAITTVSTDTHAALTPFQGPNAVTQVWVSFGGGTRTLIDPQGPFVQLTDAVALSSTTPAASTVAGFAGTGITASRGDHAHPLPTARPTAIGLSGTTVPMHPIGGGITPGALNRVLFAPHWIARPDRAPVVCTTVAVEVTSAAAAGGTVRFGLWGANADGSIAIANKIFDSAELVSTSTGLKTFTYTTAIPEGLYWVGAVAHVAICSIRGSNHGMVMQGGSPAQTSDYRYVDSVTGTLPTTGSTNVGGDGSPAFFFAFA